MYRDRNPHSHTAYQGDRTTTAFIEFIEGLGVETDHRKEVEDLKDDIQGELNAEANVIKKINLLLMNIVHLLNVMPFLIYCLIFLDVISFCFYL